MGISETDAFLEALRKLIPIPKACKLLPSPNAAGGHVNQATVWRYINKGVRHAGGRVTKLRAVRVGGVWLTSPEWIHGFLSSLPGGENLALLRPSDVAAKESA